MSAPTAQEVKALLISLLPPGAANLYSLSDGDQSAGDYLGAIAESLKSECTDLIATLRREFNPNTIVQKIPDWIGVLGLGQAAQGLSESLKRQMVIAKLREWGASTIPNIRAGAQPLLQYADPSQISILETDRALLTAAHTYGLATNAIPPGGSLFSPFVPLDSEEVSKGGATIYLNLTHPDVENLRVYLIAPSTTVYLVASGGRLGAGSVVDKQYRLFCAACAGEDIAGTWQVWLNNSAGGAATLNTNAGRLSEVFIEGIGRDGFTPSQGLGSAQFEWGVLVDPALTGVTVDYDALQLVVDGWNPAHCLGSVVVGSDADNEAIPDNTVTPFTNAIPDRCFPG